MKKFILLFVFVFATISFVNAQDYTVERVNKLRGKISSCEKLITFYSPSLKYWDDAAKNSENEKERDYCIEEAKKVKTKIDSLKTEIGSAKNKIEYIIINKNR